MREPYLRSVNEAIAGCFDEGEEVVVRGIKEEAIE